MKLRCTSELSMNRSTQHIYSTLASDPDFSDLVAMYVDEMPERIEQIQRAYQSDERETLIRLIHQLKGAAGSYGFSVLTEEAMVVEKQLVENDDDSDQAIAGLLATCERIRTGTGE